MLYDIIFRVKILLGYYMVSTSYIKKLNLDFSSRDKAKKMINYRYLNSNR